MARLSWYQSAAIPAKEYVCGYCDNKVGSAQGYHQSSGTGPDIYVCPYCTSPSFFEGERQVPGASFGNPVESVPDDVLMLYEEARVCMSVSAYTSSVLASRKLLMNIAVAQGAEPGESFVHYVDWLSEQGYVPPGGRGWVDHIRRRGNEATHEIETKSRADAEELISFVEMLLKFIYEFPAKVPTAPSA
jgi:DNA-directed RNA polymerase subunit RPC12/RpoP